jgi:hypothetical protein
MEATVSPRTPCLFEQLFLVTCLGTGVNVRSADDLHLLAVFENVPQPVTTLLASAHHVFCFAPDTVSSLSVSDEQRHVAKLPAPLACAPALSHALEPGPNCRLVVAGSTSVTVYDEELRALHQLTNLPIVRSLSVSREHVVAVLAGPAVRLLSLAADAGPAESFAHGYELARGASIGHGAMVLVWEELSLGRVSCFLGPTLLWWHQCAPLDMLLCAPRFCCEGTTVALVTVCGVYLLKTETGEVQSSLSFGNAATSASVYCAGEEVAVHTSSKTFHLLNARDGSQRSIRGALCCAPVSLTADWAVARDDGTILFLKEGRSEPLADSTQMRQLAFAEDKMFQLFADRVALFDWAHLNE